MEGWGEQRERGRRAPSTLQTFVCWEAGTERRGGAQKRLREESFPNPPWRAPVSLLLASPDLSGPPCRSSLPRICLGLSISPVSCLPAPPSRLSLYFFPLLRRRILDPGKGEAPANGGEDLTGHITEKAGVRVWAEAQRRRVSFYLERNAEEQVPLGDWTRAQLDKHCLGPRPENTDQVLGLRRRRCRLRPPLGPCASSQRGAPPVQPQALSAYLTVRLGIDLNSLNWAGRGAGNLPGHS